VSRSKASGLYTRVEHDALKASGRFVLLVFARGQVTSESTIQGVISG
jgi:hypothetical protein